MNVTNNRFNANDSTNDDESNRNDDNNNANLIITITIFILKMEYPALNGSVQKEIIMCSLLIY
jgi:hypothetical protein